MVKSPVEILLLLSLPQEVRLVTSQEFYMLELLAGLFGEISNTEGMTLTSQLDNSGDW
jgi:hypothetical protein